MKNGLVRRVLAVLAVATMIVAAGCSSSDDASTKGGSAGGGSAGGGSAGGAGKVIRVPADHATIQEAVDAAKPGDMVLVSEGVYNEAVDVTSNDITIRGTDRNKVILDGKFTLENGIRALDTEGVQVENMTARNYLSNGFYWTGSDRYRGSYLTAYRNGDYGIYAFDAYHGQFDHSIGAGSPDAGFYIGECYPCDAVVDSVLSENNGLGYSGTNSGGDLFIINSVFRNNRAGVVPNSGSYELCYPSRGTTVVGNTVYDNNNLEAPGIDVSLLAHGNGILLAGAIDAVVQRNRVFQHDRTGIAAVPFPEDGASDLPPPAEAHTKPCSETRDAAKPDASKIPGTVVWPPTGNKITDNVVEGSGLADLASATVALNPGDPETAKLGNCFAGNTVTSTAPKLLEQLAPCDGTGSGNWDDGPLDLLPLIAQQPPKPAKDTYRTTPVPEEAEGMPGDVERIPPKFTGPEKPDLASIKVPDKPAA